jgi:hypothetical protein
VRQLAAAFKKGPICPFFKDSIESGSKEAVSKAVNGAGFQPLSFLLLHSRGSAPGWYEAAPSALKLMRNHTYESAKGASHISLGQSPRK